MVFSTGIGKICDFDKNKKKISNQHFFFGVDRELE